MAVSTLPQAGPRPLRWLLGIIVVVAVALVVSLLLVFAGAGHRAASHRPVVTGGLVSANAGTVNSGSDNPANQPVFQVFGGYAPGSPYVPYVGPCVPYMGPCVPYVGQTPENANPYSYSAIGNAN